MDRVTTTTIMDRVTTTTTTTTIMDRVTTTTIMVNRLATLEPILKHFLISLKIEITN